MAYEPRTLVRASAGTRNYLCAIALRLAAAFKAEEGPRRSWRGGGMGLVDQDFSNLTVRTIDGLRVALAGLPGNMPVEVDGLVLDVMNVSELRALDKLPQPVRVRIAWRPLPDSQVHVTPAE